MNTFRHIADQGVHEGHIWDLVVGEFESPTGERFTRDIVRSPGSVGIVPLFFDAEGVPSVVLVEQYRASFDEHIIEIPAGMRDIPGEDVRATAHRELREEVGLVATDLTELFVLRPSPGMSDATTHIFLARNCEHTDKDLQGVEEQSMQQLHLRLDTALDYVHGGRITDAKTVVGLLLTDRLVASGDVGLSPRSP